MRAQQLEGIGRIGFGAWQIGDDSCGPVDEASAMHALSAAADAGANTALDCRAFADGETRTRTGDTTIFRHQT